MKSILTKIQILSFLCALPALANDVGLHNSSAQPTRTDNRTTPREITVEPGKGAIGVCQYVQKVNDGGPLDATYTLLPAGTLHDLLMNGNEVGGLAEELDLKNAIVTVLQPPKHGSLGAQPKYAYQPNRGYVGNDKIIFQVEGHDLIDGQPMKYNLVYFIKVIPEAKIDSSNQDILDKKYCPRQIGVSHQQMSC